MNLNNFFTDLPISNNEVTEDILKNSKFKIERIISRGHITAEGEWYDQETDEWVMLLTGSSIIKFDDNIEIKMEPGDFLNIPAHKKHRVIYTDNQTESIWLTIHY